MDGDLTVAFSIRFYTIDKNNNEMVEHFAFLKYGNFLIPVRVWFLAENWDDYGIDTYRTLKEWLKHLEFVFKNKKFVLNHSEVL